MGKDFFVNSIHNDNFHFHNTFEDLAKHLSLVKLEHKTMLIKGSRGMALERTLDFL